MQDMGMMNNCNHQILGILQQCSNHCEGLITMLQQSMDPNRFSQVQLLRDCADICALAARWIARGSVFSEQIAEFCARVCEACAEESGRWPDPPSQQVAQMCAHTARAAWEFARPGGMYRG